MPPEPLVLGFDTSSSNCSVALCKGAHILAKSSEQMNRGQAERLFPLLEKILKEADTSWQDLDAIGVGTGPGNFTGIRLSVSAARGLSLSLGIPSVGVTMFEALFYGHQGPVVASVDARQNSVYLAVCEGSDCAAPRISPIDKIPNDIKNKTPLCIGYESEKIARQIGGKNADASHPVAVAVSLIAADRYQTCEQRPAPFYIRSANAAPPRDAPPAILS